MRKTIGALALLVMAAAPLSAQQHQHGHGQQAPARPGDHARMMMTHHAAHAALEHRQELGLSTEQVQRLTAIDSEQTRAMRDHCARMESSGGHTAQNHDATHREMAANMERHGQEAIAVLTAAQKAQLESLHAAHHGAGAAQHGNHAAHGSAAAGHGQGHAAHHGSGQASVQGSAHAGHGNASGQHDCADCCKHMSGHAGHTTG